MKQKKRSFRSMLAAVMTVAMLLSLVPAALAAEGDTKLTIIGTSDLHGNILGYSYEDLKPSVKDGMARISTYVNTVRSENPNTILVDAGDTIQGTIMTDDLYCKGEAGHPVVAAMNYMKYDAWTLGNHEFNNGVTVMKSVIAQSSAPVLCANIKNADGTPVTGSAYTIVEKGGIKVAIIGVTTPNIPKWDGSKDGVSALQYASLVDGVAAAVKEIGTKADVIMVSAHAGLTAEYENDAAQAIVDKCPEVDLLQMGHSHQTYLNNDGRIPVGETKNNAGEVVRYDLTLDKNKDITSATVSTVSMKGIEPDKALGEVPAIKDAQTKTVSFIQDNLLGHASKDFQPVNEIKGVPEGKLQDTAVIDLINTVQLEVSGADVTACALFKDTSNLPKGSLNYGNIFDIYKFANTLYTVDITGKELKAYMEWAAECYNQWVPGDVSVSFNLKDKPGYLHDMFAGVNYEVNVSKPVGSRIENVLYKGAPLKDDQKLVLAVNDYRFSGLKSAKILSGEKKWESAESIRTMLVAYLAKHDPLEPKVDGNWKITGADLQKDSKDRATLIALINAGQLPSPNAKSLNLNDESAKAALKLAGNVKVDGKSFTAASVSEGGSTYYRLRDLAVALKGTPAAFHVSWDGKVVLEKGKEYTGEILMLASPAAGAVTTLSVGTGSVPALLADCNYYLPAGALNTLLGVTAAETSGVLTITTK